ncbi:hypothetical protein ACQ4OB_07840 [Pseudomonas sp. ES4]|uniref:hypothetical protein n=1 Tax=Pseudomonas sp. ES4 TaxID=3424777 RepID=UPI003D34955F
MSILKKAILGLVSITVTVLVTKAVEQKLELTFFSSAMNSLWEWVASVGRWLARDVTLPFWIVLILLVLVVLLLVPVLILIYAKYFEKETPSEPEGSPLSEDETVAFVVVGKAIQDGRQFGIDEVRQYSQLSRIAAQNALDNLSRKQLIYLARDRMHYNYIDLTPLGREYFLELESSTAA